ncbi:MAG: BamA/TamA family outer membrane protein [Alphaproteobacteria bacterium]|nr:BamA/TamA family outer membrane protein [Alphaproteobacteria bacterium]
MIRLWILLWLAGLCSAAQAQQSALPNIGYTVSLQGPADPSLGKRIRDEITLEKRKQAGVPSLPVLQSRLDSDLERIEHVLKAFGYYDGHASGVIVEGATAEVRIVVDEGPLYRIGIFSIVWDGAQPTAPPETIVEGLPASGTNIVAAGERIVAALREDGYFDAAILERRAVLDRPAGKVDVTYTIASGPPVVLGGIAVEGNADLPASRVARLSKLEIGALLTPKVMKDAEDNLMKSAVFDEARADAVGKGTPRTVRLTVDERLWRSFSGAIKWSLQDGYAIEAAWEHRNIFGDAERLRASVTYGSQRKGVAVNYQEYDVFWPDYTLNASLIVDDEDVDDLAYQQVALIGTLETELLDKLILRFGGSLEFVHDESFDRGGDFALVGLRGELAYDTTDDLLDPTKGFRAALRINPYFGVSNDFRQFTIVEAIGSAYFALDDDNSWIAAGRLRLGTVVGDRRDDIPLPKRLFAGGGGSIRGFGYKRAGPIDDEDRPIGGASVLEINAEMRWRINEDFGAVAFVDAGGAYEDPVPDFHKMFVGAGLGVRYYSPIGPVRLDVAMPVSGGKGEADYQIYVSIGQAF